MKKILLNLAVLALIALGVGCSNPSGGGGGPPPPPNSITGFTVAGAAGTINTEARTVTVTLPQGTALTALSPVISINGADISPASGEAQNFFTSGGYSPVIYTVTGEDSSEVIWTVTVKWQALAPGADIATYLATAESGIPGGPVILPVSMDLSGNGWSTLLTTIHDASAVSAVALDLSACTMGGTEFDPQPGPGDAGESKIVSLILPNTATSIKAGTYNDPTFKDFDALKSVTGGAVISVGDYAFRDCDDLETVSLPAATSIGWWAFSRCTGLTSVSLPAATSIDTAAFYGCTGLTSVSLPAATSIDNSAFIGCDAMETVSLPAATSIGYSAFFNCGDLTTVSLPAATSIGYSAFSSCRDLTTVSLPVVVSIGVEAFYNCTALTSISLPASLTTIEGNPFPGCPNLTISVAAANPKYMVEGGNKLLTKDGKTLVGWPGASGNVTLNGITTIDDSAFSRCTGLTSVSLPATTSISSSAFFECTALTSVDLPAATSIGYSAFSYCRDLTTVSLPVVVSIGARAFAFTGTTASLAITLGDTPPELGGEIFSNVTGGPKVVTITVPDNAAWTGKTATYTGSENTTGGPHWGEGFRGKGWTSGGAYVDSSSSIVNENINLTITAE